MLRAAIMIIVGIDTALWLWLLGVALLVDSSSLGEGSAMAFALIPGAALLVFTLPAFILALRRQFLGLSLTLAMLSLASTVLFV